MRGELSDRHLMAAQADAIAIRRIGIDEPTAWLAAGWHDMMQVPVVSLGYGAIFMLVSQFLFLGLTTLDLGSLILPLAGGFLLIGPLAAVGFYEISRRLERGEAARLGDAFLAWRENADQIALMGVALLVAMFVWIQVALILFALFFEGSPPTLTAFVAELFSGWHNVPFLLIGTIAGGILAALVFAISVVSVPMLLDRDVTAPVAIITSLRAVQANWRVLIGWAATIAVLTALGIVTFFVGLLVVMPLLGHASWHAYRAVVR